MTRPSGTAAVQLSLWALVFASLAMALVQPVQAQAACAPVAVWATDAAGGGFVVSQLNPSADVIDIHAGLAGDACSDITIGITVGAQVGPDIEEISIDHVVDLLEPEGSAHDYALTFTFTERSAAGGNPSGQGAIVDPYVTLTVDGDALYDSQPNTATEAGPLVVTWNGDDVLDMTIPRAEFGDLLGWAGFSEQSGDALPDLGGPPGIYTADTLATDVTFSLFGGVGAPLLPGAVGNPSDTDNDGLNDTCETQYFGNLTVTDNATADPDGDGLTNGQECALGTDPTKADTDGDGVNDKDDPFPTDATKGGSNTTSSSSSSSRSTGSSTSRSSSTTGGNANGSDSKGEVTDLAGAIDRLADDPGYLGMSAGGLLAVLVLCIIALAVRWSL